MRKFSFFLLSILALSASAEITWLSRTYNFGSFMEEAGPQKGEVKLVNTGNEPTIISRVKSTCGCTVAGYTEGLINPGDTAAVWFTYNPTGRPGRFEKHIKVYTGENNDVTSITIKGTVIGSSSTLASSYPVEAGKIRLSSANLDMGKVTYGISRHEYVSAYNVSTDTLNISWTPTPRSISLGVSNKRVAPGDIFTIGAYFNSRDETELGPLSYTVKFYPDSADTQNFVPIVFTADIAPDTSKLTEEQLRLAPSAMLYPRVVEIGEISTSDKKPHKFSFKIMNEGKTPLKVHRVCIPGSQVLRVKQMPTKVEPGKEHEIKAELMPEFIEAGPFALDVQVVTDDPIRPTRTIRLAGEKR